MADLIRARYTGGSDTGMPSYEALKAGFDVCLSREQQRLSCRVAKLAARMRALRGRARLTAQRAARHKYERLLIQHLGALSREHAEALQRAKNSCLELALELAESVLAQQIAIDSRPLIQRINSVLSHLETTPPLRIAVHPCAVDELMENLIRLNSEFKGLVSASAVLPPGGAIIQTASGQIIIDLSDELRQDGAGLAGALSSLSQGQNNVDPTTTH